MRNNNITGGNHEVIQVIMYVHTINPYKKFYYKKMR
jgi:hypothetical protein